MLERGRERGFERERERNQTQERREERETYERGRKMSGEERRTMHLKCNV